MGLLLLIIIISPSTVLQDDSSGLALSVYIRKLSFSPSISGQMDFNLHDGDYTIKATFGKIWVRFVYGKGVKFKITMF